MKTVKNNSAMAELRDAAVRRAAAGELLTGFFISCVLKRTPEAQLRFARYRE
jgi:hypothetical protein